MRSLIYVSSALTQWDEQSLEQLLTSARRWNEPRGLTGMLLYSGGNFIQAVEGEDSRITEVFERIRRDSRHRGILVLLNEPIIDREFPGFSMGYRRLSSDAPALEGHTDFLGDPAGAAERGREGSAPMIMLETFRKTMR